MSEISAIISRYSASSARAAQKQREPLWQNAGTAGKRRCCSVFAHEGRRSINLTILCDHDIPSPKRPNWDDASRRLMTTISPEAKSRTPSPFGSEFRPVIVDPPRTTKFRSTLPSLSFTSIQCVSIFISGPSLSENELGIVMADISYGSGVHASFHTEPSTLTYQAMALKCIKSTFVVSNELVVLMHQTW